MASGAAGACDSPLSVCACPAGVNGERVAWSEKVHGGVHSHGAEIRRSAWYPRMAERMRGAPWCGVNCARNRVSVAVRARCVPFPRNKIGMGNKRGQQGTGNKFAKMLDF